MARPMTSFQVLCPLCGDPDATVSLDLNDLTRCECSNCGEDFAPADAIRHLTVETEKWKAIARWIAMAPEAVMASPDHKAEALVFEF